MRRCQTEIGTSHLPDDQRMRVKRLIIAYFAILDVVVLVQNSIIIIILVFFALHLNEAKKNH